MRFFFPLLSLLISGTLFFFIVRPWYGDVTQLRSDVAAYSTALDNSAYLQRTQDTLLGQFKNLKSEDKTRLENFLPNTVDNIEFILQVEQLANLYNMPIKNIKFDNPKDTDTATTPSVGSIIPAGAAANLPYGVFTLQFDTQGTYSQFNSFLKDLEHNLRLVDVKSISFSVPVVVKGSTAGTDPNVYDYTLQVNTYWLK
jgi:hypothetical protein